MHNQTRIIYHHTKKHTPVHIGMGISQPSPLEAPHNASYLSRRTQNSPPHVYRTAYLPSTPTQQLDFICICFFLWRIVRLPFLFFVNEARMQRSPHHVQAHVYIKILSLLRQPVDGKYKQKHVAVHYIVFKWSHISQLCLIAYHFPIFTVRMLLQ